jgi:hypothetical protein
MSTANNGLGSNSKLELAIGYFGDGPKDFWSAS